MKLIFFLIIMCSVLSCKAQNPIITIYNIDTSPDERTVVDNYYYKDLNNHHDAVVGVWKWEDGGSSFEITLQEFEQYSDPIAPNQYVDAIFGKYKYILNNEIITEVTDIQTYLDFKISLGFRSPTEYGIVLRDVVSETAKTGTFILTSPTTATIELRSSEGVKVNYGNGQDWALPTSLVLTKQ